MSLGKVSVLCDAYYQIPKSRPEFGELIKIIHFLEENRSTFYLYERFSKKAVKKIVSRTR
jgi:hypothetical protein